MFRKIIVDESTMIKTVTSARFKDVKKVCEKAEYLILLSGTPMMNGAAELFSPLLLLEHPLAGDGTKASQMAFEKVFAGGFWKKIKSTEGLAEWELKRNFWKYYQWWAKGANHVRELRWMMRENFMFKQKGETDVFKKKTRRIERLKKCAKWEDEYARAWSDYLEKVAEHNKQASAKTAKNVFNITELKRLIENGQVYQVNSRWKAQQVVADIAAGKYGDKRIILFSIFIETDRMIQEELAIAGVSYRTFDDVKEWKWSDDQVLVGRIKSHAKGGNAAEACVTIMVDMDFVPTMNMQAENRMDRPEQKNEMEVVYYMAEGEKDIDAHVQAINMDKMRKIDEFMRPFTPEEEVKMPEMVEALRKKYSKEFAKLEAGYEKVRG